MPDNSLVCRSRRASPQPSSFFSEKNVFEPIKRFTLIASPPQSSRRHFKVNGMDKQAVLIASALLYFFPFFCLTTCVKTKLRTFVSVDIKRILSWLYVQSNWETCIPVPNCIELNSMHSETVEEELGWISCLFISEKSRKKNFS